MLVMTHSEAKPQSQIQLTPEEMIEISHEINRRFAPKAAPIIPDRDDFAFNDSELYAFLQLAHSETKTVLHSIHDSRIGLSPKELYDISQAIGGGFMPDAVTAAPELILLPVDPDHLYAYWNLGENALPSQITSGNGLTLRIYWRPDQNPGIAGSNVWFDVDVYETNARQKVRLPIDDSAYSAALGKVNPDNSFEAYMHSNIIRVPPSKTTMSRFQQENQKNVSRENQDAAHNARSGQIPPAIQRNKKDALIEYKLSDIQEQQGHAKPIIENGWYVKLHFRQPAAYDVDKASNDTRLKDLLNNKAIDIQLIPEPFFYESAPFEGKTASGQGIG